MRKRHASHRRHEMEKTSPTPFVMFAAAEFIFLGYVATRLYFLKRPPSSSTPLPIRGWLVPVGLLVVYLCVSSVLSLVDAARPFSPERWQSFTQVGGEHYDPLWRTFLIFSLIGRILLASNAVFLSVLFWGRRRLFVVMFAVFMGIEFLYDTAITVMMIQMPVYQTNSMYELAYLVLMAGLMAWWTTYLFRSKRARDTFVL
jgi:hypothetical protein